MSIILQTSLQMFHSNPHWHALVFKQNSLISCYIITSIHLPVKPREWFCCLRIREKYDLYTLQAISRGGKLSVKKTPSVISFWQPNNNSNSEFPLLLQAFFFNKELFKSTYPFKLQFILYHHLSKFKTKIKLLTFCPKFHPYFQSLFFNRISNLKSIWIPYRQLLRQNNDIVSESVSFVSSHCISKL